MHGYYADARYLLDPHKDRFQLEIITVHEASRQYYWPRAMDQHIQVSCGLCYKEETPKSLHKDNVIYIAQLKGRYIKRNGMKYIFSKVLLHS